MEWNELASQSLPTLGGGGGLATTTTPGSAAAADNPQASSQQQQWNRNLSELQMASQTLLHNQHGGGGTAAAATTTSGGSSIINMNNNTAGAQNILGSASYYYPMTTTTSTGGGGGETITMRDADTTTTHTTTPAATTATLEERVAYSEEQLLRQILQDASEKSKHKTNARIEKNLDVAWNKERDVWLREIVGTRTLGGASSLSTSSTTTTSPLQQQHQSTSNTNNIISRTSAGGRGPPSPSSSSLLMPIPGGTGIGGITNNTTDSTLLFTTKLDPSLIGAHLQVVQQTIVPPGIGSSSGSGSNSNSTAVTQPFIRLIQMHPTLNRPAVDAGYKSSWLLISHMLNNNNNNNGGQDRMMMNDPVQRARASLGYLCQSFRLFIFEQLRRSSQWDSNNTAGNNLYKDSTTATAIAQYVQLIAPPPPAAVAAATSANNSSATADLMAWATLYYCLRCGDAVAALAVSKTMGDNSGGVPDSLRRLLAAWADVQRDAPSVWELQTTNGNAMLLPNLNSSDRQAVADLVPSSSSSSQASSNVNPYASGVYSLASALLSQLPPSSSDVSGMNTIEDYLTFSLTKAVMSTTSNPIDELAQVGDELTNRFGPTYFADNGESGGWSYAFPLLATQQYQMALQHLQSQGGVLGLLQATHIALVLTNVVGIQLNNLTPKSRRDLLTSSASSAQSSRMLDDVSQASFAASLISAYANQLLAEPSIKATTAALEYLVRIPYTPRAAKEVASLIAKTQDTDNLAGRLNAQGIRESNTVLDQFFTPDQVSSILVDGAEQSLRRTGSSTQNQQQRPSRSATATAVLCYMLGGRYANVLQLMSQLLSPPDHPDDDRAFWMEQTESFHTNYTDIPTHVLQVLEEKPQDKATIETSRTLIQLNRFFALLQAGRALEAWQVAEPLQLWPNNHSDLASKDSGLKRMDPLVRAALPALLVGAVFIMHQEYQRLKKQQHQQGGGVTRESARELQEKVKLLVTYSNSVGVDSKQKAMLSDYESHMI